jgi:hypothetical protein
MYRNPRILIIRLYPIQSIQVEHERTVVFGVPFVLIIIDGHIRVSALSEAQEKSEAYFLP